MIVARCYYSCISAPKSLAADMSTQAIAPRMTSVAKSGVVASSHSPRNNALAPTSNVADRKALLLLVIALPLTFELALGIVQ
jgi:hypothetical protein